MELRFRTVFLYVCCVALIPNHLRTKYLRTCLPELCEPKTFTTEASFFHWFVDVYGSFSAERRQPHVNVV